LKCIAGNGSSHIGEVEAEVLAVAIGGRRQQRLAQRLAAAMRHERDRVLGFLGGEVCCGDGVGAETIGELAASRVLVDVADPTGAAGAGDVRGIEAHRALAHDQHLGARMRSALRL
jgi:hypothetical protein